MPSKDPLLYVIVSFWSGMVSYSVARWTNYRQNSLNDKKDFVKLIEKIEDASVSYWLDSGRNKAAEATLKGDLKKITQEIPRLFKGTGKLFEKLERYSIDFRKEITGGSFESDNRLEEQGRATNIQDIALEIITLVKSST